MGASVSERGDTADTAHGGGGNNDPLFSPDEFTAAVASVTSAFGDPTRREIYLFARAADDGVRTSDVAAHFALHPNVARHHLEKLAGGGYLEVKLSPHTSAGRPVEALPRIGSRHAAQLPAAPRRPARHTPCSRHREDFT